MHAKLISALALVAMVVASTTAAEAEYPASSHPLDRRTHDDSADKRSPIVLEPGMQPFHIPESLRGKIHILKRDDAAQDAEKRSPIVLEPGMKPMVIPDSMRGKIHILKRDDNDDEALLKRSPYVLFDGPNDGFVRPYPLQTTDGEPRVHPMALSDKTTASKRSLSISPDRAA